MTNFILFGPPGSGKGTQAEKLVDRYNLLHISTGELFRHELGNNTELGKKARSYMEKGELVPDEITIGMLRNKVRSNQKVDGYIFDGFPRTLNQAVALDRLMDELEQSIDLLLMLVVDEEEIIQRILKRGETSGREDDLDKDIIRNRIEVYQEETAPVFDYYDKQGKARKINGMGGIDDIFGRLSAAVRDIRD